MPIFIAVVAAVCSSFAFSFDMTSEGILTASWNTPLAIMALIVAGICYGRLCVESHDDICHRDLLNLPAFLVALVFSLATTLGEILVENKAILLNGISFWNCSYNGKVISMVFVGLIWLGFFVFYYGCVTWAFRGIAEYQRRHCVAVLGIKSIGRPCIFGKKIPSYAGIIVILIAAWMPYIVIFGPTASFPSDTSHQMAQYYGVGAYSLDSHFPYLTTLFYAACYEFGLLFDSNGLLGWTFVNLSQVVLGLYVFSTIVVWLKRIGNPKWLVYGSLAFFALFPLIPVYLNIPSKDTPHALLVALFALQLLLRYTFEKNKLAKHWLYSPIAIAIVGTLVATTRNNGIFLVIAGLAILLVVAWNKKMFAAALAMTLACGCWQFVALPSMGVASAGYAEALNVPCQIIGAVSRNIPKDELFPDELTFIEENFEGGYEAVAYFYNPKLSDPLKVRNLNANSISGALEQIAMSGKMALRHPRIAIGSVLYTTHGVWYPFAKGTVFDEDAPYLTLPVAPPPGSVSWSNPEWFAGLDQLAEINKTDMIYKDMVKFVKWFHGAPVISLLYTPAAYTWVIVLLLGYVFYARRRRKVSLTTLSPYITLTLILLVGPISSLRYSIPMVMGLPVILSLLFAKDISDGHEEDSAYTENAGSVIFEKRASNKESYDKRDV